MKDVAREAGVSVNTVSRVLSGKPDVSPQTRAKVLEVVRRLGYRPNRLARGLRSSRTGTIGVIVTDIANPFFGALVKGIERAARVHEYNIILQNTNEDYEQEREAVQIMLAEQVDGLLVTPTQNGTDTINELKKAGLPFVLVGRYFHDIEADCVVTDDIQGGFLATEHLIKLGHRKIAMVNGPLYISSAQERFEGYKRALTYYGIKLEKALVYSGAISMEDGFHFAKKLLKQRNRPTAIFCYSDFVAIGVIQAAYDAGLTIPKDVSVVGYDDITFSAHVRVPLTTVRIPKQRLGQRAVDLLLQRIKETENRGETRLERLSVELIVRDSTGERR